jgi:hypothetical protein
MIRLNVFPPPPPDLTTSEGNTAAANEGRRQNRHPKASMAASVAQCIGVLNPVPRLAKDFVLLEKHREMHELGVVGERSAMQQYLAPFARMAPQELS